MEEKRKMKIITVFQPHCEGDYNKETVTQNEQITQTKWEAQGKGKECVDDVSFADRWRMEFCRPQIQHRSVRHWQINHSMTCQICVKDDGQVVTVPGGGLWESSHHHTVGQQDLSGGRDSPQGQQPLLGLAERRRLLTETQRSRGALQLSVHNTCTQTSHHNAVHWEAGKVKCE